MIATSVKFKGHRCFRGDWAGFDSIRPINVIIGRNNTGKSHLLDLVSALCDKRTAGHWSYRFVGRLQEAELQTQFDPGRQGGDLQGNHWCHHSIHFVEKEEIWETDEKGNVSGIEFAAPFKLDSPYGAASTSARTDLLSRILRDAKHEFYNRNFRRLLADRDIRPEAVGMGLELNPDGAGATNIIRRYIVSSIETLPRDLIQKDLLEALNKIFASDGFFAEIEVQLHDEKESGYPEGHWEVYLGEEKKGLIALSRSGSGLKTVFLVLLNLLVVPKIQKQDKSRYVFAFEELENNLHPALLRRLFQYLEEYAVREKATIFLTTHSSVALDLYGLSANAQITYVTHDGEFANAQAVAAHFDHLGVISELGAKPSDLLQANGIIWVEGPSDCIYLNRWIDLMSNGRLREGRDYQCAFYGGSLLACTQFRSPTEAEKELINLFRVNSNIIVVCDGDRGAAKARVKDRVRRISGEVRKIPGAHVWITQGREIESYLPGPVFAKALGLATLPDPTQFEPIFPRKGNPRVSYLEVRAKRKSVDKMEIAILSVREMDKVEMVKRFDWASQMKIIVDRIDAWNR